MQSGVCIVKAKCILFLANRPARPDLIFMLFWVSGPQGRCGCKRPLCLVFSGMFSAECQSPYGLYHVDFDNDRRPRKLKLPARCRCLLQGFLKNKGTELENNLHYSSLLCNNEFSLCHCLAERTAHDLHTVILP